jgi:hypothetical protein
VFYGAEINEVKPPNPIMKGLIPFGFWNYTKGLIEYVEPPCDKVTSNSRDFM